MANLGKVDKPSRLRFCHCISVEVFVKVNQNNYKYWDGYAVYSNPLLNQTRASAATFPKLAMY